MTKDEIRQKYEREHMTQKSLGKFIDSSPLVDFGKWKTWPGHTSYEKAGYLIKEWGKKLIYEIY